MLSPEDCLPRKSDEAKEQQTVPPTFPELIDFRASQMETSHDRASLKDRLKMLRRSIGGGWRRSKPTNASSLGSHPVGQPTCLPLPGNGMVNQSWGPSIRKGIKSMTSSLRGNRSSMDTSEDSSRSADIHAEPRRFDSRRVATIGCSRGRLISVDRSRSHLRRSSLSNMDDIRSRIGSAPKLPGLGQSTGLLDALNDTGLFPPLICSPSSQPISETTVQASVIEARRGITLKNPIRTSQMQGSRAPPLDLDSFHRCRRRRQMNFDSKSDTSSMSNRSIGQVSDKGQQMKPEPEKSDAVNRSRQHREMNDSSRHPIEWVDYVIKSSWETRNPIDPELDVSGEDLERLKRTKTCIFVVVAKDSEFPKPRPVYSGFKAALEDVHDRFGIFYAEHAAFNCATREITLYPRDQERPKEKRIDDDTYLFDIAVARSTWINPPPPVIWKQQYRARMFHMLMIAKSSRDKQMAMVAAARKAAEAATKEAAQLVDMNCTGDELTEWVAASSTKRKRKENHRLSDSLGPLTTKRRKRGEESRTNVIHVKDTILVDRGATFPVETASNDENRLDAKDTDMVSRLGT
ncbi:hypothetical protein F5Y18DRAFT_222633 [Xylariaceae sp. FL1019]|nr:hypothetical protein F5Y18DRAFT_222633 [Xylariaceae sp. FL1019]